jgi:phosphatidylglycerophosphatase C
MKKLYLFDFDGTLTNKDTMFLFLKFYNPKKYYFSLIKYAPLFAMLKFKMIDAEKVKQYFIAALLKNESQANLAARAEAFYEAYHHKIIRPAAKDFLQKLDLKQNKAYIVSASLDIWVAPFAQHFGFGLLATKADFEAGKYTGFFASKNCNGPEKVKRIKAEINVEDFDKIIAFGDTNGDKAMLAFANEGHFRFFE